MMKLVNILSLSLLLIFLLSCKEDEVISPEGRFDLFGDWIVTEYLHTNGPICYDINVNDIISFNKLEPFDSIIFTYSPFDLQFNDTFAYSQIDNKFIANGNYHHVDSNSYSFPDEYVLKQNLIIDFIDYNQIECFLRIESFDYKTNQYNFGDVSHFKAKRIVRL